MEEIPDRAGTAVDDLAFEYVPDSGTVALGVRSRGIVNLSAVVRGVVERVDDLRYGPFVVPAMGSHGGATADGQREMLASLGVTGDAIGCEIQSSMAVEQAGETPERGVPVVVHTHAADTDEILPVNRLKPHTD
ncbi:MAG: hypothetical protein RI568_15360 [Natronomonas sp.]|jgi:hypothetical protein|uniref:hypothetical protein n=1 Tax=Natronomonas sp. TaxID=2184060 RepID=UPI0028703B32|nr:hypothetical protein [Natronomonas sp.]MDR9432058.1 hypothetical protein [Natronomonas sp.]